MNSFWIKSRFNFKTTVAIEDPTILLIVMAGILESTAARAKLSSLSGEGAFVATPNITMRGKSRNPSSSEGHSISSNFAVRTLNRSIEDVPPEGKTMRKRLLISCGYGAVRSQFEYNAA